MFDAVAPKYDLLNRMLSAGIDGRWRRRAVRELAPERGHTVLDLCAGTGDLGFTAAREPGVSVVGVDLARKMLARGHAKRGGRRVRFVQADGERLPLPDASVERACVGFGIRNMSSLSSAFDETLRVLKPGGRFVILEFTTPPNPLLRSLYHAYFHHVLPRVGGWVSGDAQAYTYLPASVSEFPAPSDLAALLTTRGFRDVRWSLLSGGIACLHVAER